MKTLNNFNFKNQKVLARCDFNCPLDERGDILDDFRIKAVLPTIKYLIEKEAKIILMSHLGRPDGKVVESLRLTPVQKKLKELLNLPVKKTQDCVGKEVEDNISQMKAGEILLLENVQFNPGEKNNDPDFAKTLASYGDIFIMEAFGQAHRDYASTAGIPKYLPSGAGLLLEKEIKFLSQILKDPKKPLIVIIGGSKAEDKAKVIEKFSNFCDFLLVGNLVAKEIKENKVEVGNMEKIIFPVLDGKALDLDEKTIEIFKERIFQAKTIFWAGPLGEIEEEKYQKGTIEIAKAIIKSKAFSVVGGGDTVEFLNKVGLVGKFNHVSTGGGAMLNFLSGEKLPGIEALK
jgi:phosphoglycerate kinase